MSYIKTLLWIALMLACIALSYYSGVDLLPT